MKLLVLICAFAATAVGAHYTNGYISYRTKIGTPSGNAHQYGQYPLVTTANQATFSEVESTDAPYAANAPVGEFRERKTHQFEATHNNTFARHPERQIIGVLNTDFVPSDEFTDVLLAYLPDITEILKEVKIANGGEMPALGNNPAHWLKMLLPLGRRYLQTRARLEGRDYLWPGEEKALHFVDRVTDPMMQFVKELL